MAIEAPQKSQDFKSNDFASNQEVRWCPGCGDYSILSQMKKVLSLNGVHPDQHLQLPAIQFGDQHFFESRDDILQLRRQGIDIADMGVCHR